MQKYLYILAIISITLPCLSQQDLSNSWLMGNTNVPFSLPMQIDFSSGILNNSLVNRSIRLFATASTISDNQGNLLFYTNGVVIGNQLNDTMQNSQGFNPGYLTNSQSNGLNMIQNCLIIPFPDDSNKYYVFHESCEIINWGAYYYPLRLAYSVVDMSLNSELGGVTDKNITLISDTLSGGNLSAVKHANGRDWWVIVPVPNADFVYTLLITPNGIQGHFQRRTDGIIWNKQNIGVSIFSPDGSKYVRYDYSNDLNIFNFK